MADLVDGPPTKRPKMSSPSLSGNENNDIFGMLDELPDELENLVSDNAGNSSQNGNILQQQGLDTIQKHQQLSQLLSSNPTPSGQNMNNSTSSHVSLGRSGPVQASQSTLNSLSSVRSPLQNPMGSPPNKNMLQNTSHALHSEITAGSSFNSVGPTSMSVGGNISFSNSTVRPSASPAMLNNQGAMNQSHILNGPHSLTGQQRGLGNVNNFPSSISQPNNMVGTLVNNGGQTLAQGGPLAAPINPASSIPQMSNVPGQPMTRQPGPAQSTLGKGQPATAEQEKRKLIQQQLVLLLHAHKCQRREQANGEVRSCTLPHCRTMKNVLTHMTTCSAGKDCPVSHCASSRQIIAHWKNCTRNDCPVCLPLKNASDKKNNPAQVSTASQPQNNTGPVPTEAEMKKAYMALGLQPPNPGTLRPPRPIANPGITSSVPLSGVATSTVGAPNQNVAGAQGGSLRMPGSGVNNPLGSPNSLVNAVGDGSNNMTAMPNRPVKEWHKSVTQDLRNHLVHKLVQAIFPTPDPAALRDRRMHNLVQYARKVEADMYETANSREEYYHLLAEKIYKIQKELEEKRLRRMREHVGNNPQQPNMSGMQQPRPNNPGGAVGATNVLNPRLMTPNMPASNPYGSQGNVNLNRMPNLNIHGGGVPRAQQSQSTLTQVLSSTGPNVGVAQEKLQNALKNRELQLQQQQLQEQQKQRERDISQLQQQLANSIPTSVQQQQAALQNTTVAGPVCQHPDTSSSIPQALDSLITGTDILLSTSEPQDVKPDFKDIKVEHSQTELNEEIVPEIKKEEPTNEVMEVLQEVEPKVEVKLEPKEEIKTEPVDSSHQVPVDEKREIKSEQNGDSSNSNNNESVDVKTNSQNSQSVPETPSPSAQPQPKPRVKKVWNRDELRQALMPTLEKLYKQEPDSLPFRQPVDPVALAIPDYYEIIKKPMDLSQIRKKLDTGQYNDPWEYVDDVWLMFDNAWLYNRKNSRVYKYCTKLAEVFEAEIDGVMQSLGFCCGRKYVFHPQVLCCYGKQLCTIPRDAVYFSYQNRNNQALLNDRYTFCDKCFNDIKGDEVELTEDPTQPPTRIKKEEFVKEKNDKLDYEPFVECQDCGRKQHQICVLHMDTIWPQGFICDNCLRAKGAKRKENRFIAKRLPNTKLGTYLENRINSFLKKKDAGAGEVTIRVLSSSDKVVEVKPGMKQRYVDTKEMEDNFPYRAKAMFAFEEIDGVDVCFFGMHVQEYGSDAPYPNTRRVYIAYLDSVYFFQPREFRTAVYHEMLIGYMDYVKSLGYTQAHIWACPPSEGDDYIFHCHPPEQKIPKPKRLQEWYRKMLDKAIIERVVIDYKDILKDAIENNLTSAAELPYFEGDFWPGVLEESIKELEQEEEEEKKKKEEAAAMADPEDIGEDSNDGIDVPSGSAGHAADKKKGKSCQKKKQKNKGGAIRKNNKKSSLPYGGNDLSAKLYSTMEKHKEVFFVIRLHSVQNSTNLPPIQDPDPLITNDLMDGRDAFLTMAREKHYEFSSLRRCKFSSMALLYELHNSGKDSFVYTCNHCKNQVETRFHCRTCDDYDLCVPCYKKLGHEHKMDKLGFGFDDDESNMGKQQNPQEARKLSIQRCITSLLHACQCRDANCRLPSCQKMKRIVAHTKNCKRKTNGGCPICKQLIALCCYHAKYCQEGKCPVPFCLSIKNRLKQQQLQQRLQQAQLLRRRMALMQGNRPMPSSSSSHTSQAQSPAHPSSSASQSPFPAAAASGGKPAQPPPPAAMQAAQQAQMAAQRQAGTNIPNQYSNQPNSISQMNPVVRAQPSQIQGPQQTPIPQHQQPQMAPNSIPGNATRMGLPPMDRNNWPGNYPQGQQQSHMNPPNNMQNIGMQQNPQINVNMNAPQRPGGTQVTQAALQKLLQTLKSPTSPQQQQQVLNILKTHPQLMAAFIKQRQQQQGGMVPGSQQMIQQPPQQQQWLQQQQMRQRLQQQSQQMPNMQQQFQQPQQPPPGYPTDQRARMNFQQQTGFQGNMMSQQFPQQQMMQQVQQQTAQLKQQMVGGKPVSPQHMLAAQQGNQSPLSQVRSPPPSLPTTVRSSQPIPSPRQPNTVPSPLGQNIPHPGMPGAHGLNPNDGMTTDQVMLSQLQNSHSNQDMSVMGQNDGDVTPLTPQDQLSRFVDNL